MKRAFLFFSLIFLLNTQVSSASEATLYLNAFGETATAYLNDAFLLMGTTADGFVANIIQKDTAGEIVKNVQKRVRLIRAKLKAVSSTNVAELDKQLIVLLDNAFACMDQQSSTLIQYIDENVDKKSPESARRFEGQRTECLARLKKIADFYASLPPSPEVAEPLSTR